MNIFIKLNPVKKRGEKTQKEKKEAVQSVQIELLDDEEFLDL